MATKQAKHRRLAFAVVPQVLAKGIEIGNHPKHKGRDYDTVTFAAPLEINGQRGNLAVVVRKEGKNYYKAHRLVMPDGTHFGVAQKFVLLLGYCCIYCCIFLLGGFSLTKWEKRDIL